MSGWIKGIQAHDIIVAGCASDVSAVKRWRAYWPLARFHLFEVEPSNVEMLHRAFDRDPLIRINEQALAGEVGEVEFYANAIPMVSSRLPFNRQSARFVPGWGNETRMVVPSTTMDAYCTEQGIERIGLIELDVQGGELDALRGAAALLGRRAFGALIVEVFTTELYQGVPLEPAVSDYLATFGYRQVDKAALANAGWADIIYMTGGNV